MNFSTKIPIKKSNFPINYNSKIMLLGSCFSENIGSKFEYFKFQNTINPFGIIFNPISIENLIYRAIENIEFNESDVFFHDDLWKCFEVHSDLNCESKTDLLQNLKRLLIEFKRQLSQSSHIIITYGTSWVYQNKTSNKIVANCHKVPQTEFNKELLTVEIIGNSIQNSINLIQKANPNCNITFTISPVRHIKDGFIENSISKSHLISAVNSVLQSNIGVPPLGARRLFPSYEIMMDELRDYRFYAQDMLHPNQMAIDYIWERFVDSQISEESKTILVEVDTIQKGLLHRPFNPKSESYLKFLKNLDSKIDLLQIKNPEIKF